ncbi:Protein FAR1-RELATED SEQUENCE 9 [Ananas comosus]|uniref:Protein FAR1-RELATED SEQUENCE n=1 Tax=Ananas comosus TaxID=4615 RepID=A0A199VKG1_ANACO|nr:Protein FAR1-RELATED SEQUENCE 9 [Ananas comosus]
MNALTKMFMDNHTSICKLVIQFEKMVSSRYDKEDEADFRSRDGESSLWSHNPIEIQARSVYTKRVFSEFKNQFRWTTGYDLTELENNCYKISTIQNSTLPAQGINSFIVTSSPSMEKVSCSCKFFEFSGLLCSHALKVMLHVRMHQIPSDYIIKRWTKDAKKGSSSINFQSMLTGDSSNAKGARLNALTLKMQKLLFEASKTFENYEMTCEKIDKLVDDNIKLYESLKEKQDHSENIVEHHTATIFSQASSLLSEEKARDATIEETYKASMLVTKNIKKTCAEQPPNRTINRKAARGGGGSEARGRADGPGERDSPSTTRLLQIERERA